MTQPTLEQFLADVKNHELTIIQNDGVYRQLTFNKPGDYDQYFNITTLPSYLIITGDMGSLVFSRQYDMFNFFRSENLSINLSRWAEDIRTTSWDARIESYSEFDTDKVKVNAKIYLNKYIQNNNLSEDDKEDLLEAFKFEILYSEDEHEIVEAIRNFSFKGFEFVDFWEGYYRKYRYHYIWLCYAIVWGIKKFDELNEE